MRTLNELHSEIEFLLSLKSVGLKCFDETLTACETSMLNGMSDSCFICQAERIQDTIEEMYSDISKCLTPIFIEAGKNIANLGEKKNDLIKRYSERMF